MNYIKRLIALLTVIALILVCAGCSASSNKSNNDTASKADATTADTATADSASASGKAIVVYFSRTGEQYGVGVIEKGNTAIVADMIAEIKGADTFEIKPKTDTYPTTYKELTDVAKEEQNQNARPEIVSKIESFDNYDTVYLGYPIWWNDLPMICYTFLESYDFSGKTIVPFCTHEGSSDAGTQDKIQKAVPNAKVKTILAVKGADTQNSPDSVKQTVTDWLAK